MTRTITSNKTIIQETQELLCSRIVSSFPLTFTMPSFALSILSFVWSIIWFWSLSSVLMSVAYTTIVPVIFSRISSLASACPNFWLFCWCIATTSAMISKTVKPQKITISFYFFMQFLMSWYWRACSIANCVFAWVLHFRYRVSIPLFNKIDAVNIIYTRYIWILPLVWLSAIQVAFLVCSASSHKRILLC